LQRLFQNHLPLILQIPEHSFLEKTAPQKRKVLFEAIFKRFSKTLPCVVVTGNIKPFRELLESTGKHSIPVLKTTLKTSKFHKMAVTALEEYYAPMVKMHGVLVEVYGLGVLITGESGIGKSECALELIKRGHMFVADDVVTVKLRPGNVLIGSGEKIISHHIEVRGIGIIDIKSIFGTGAILDATKIELVIKLEEWNSVKEYDRLGIDDKTTDIIFTKVPEVALPVKPGRNLAVLIEIAALNQRLKQKGHYSAKILNEKLIEEMTSGKQGL